MADEIETAAELIKVAELRQVVIHELIGNRNATADLRALDSRPEELHAPDTPDDEAAVNLCTRLEDEQLGVRCRIETCNAYGSFVVEGEAIFFLPTPVSRGKPEIVQEFTEQVGALAVYPYVRSAIASLAAQMSIPASPLPLLHAGDLTLTVEDEPIVEEKPSEFLMHGIATRTSDNGEEEIAEFFVDEESGLVSRFGGEGQTPELDELLDALAALPPPQEVTVAWMVREYGESAVRQSVEALRSTDGDAATDAALAEIDDAVAQIAMEDAFKVLSQAVDLLGASIETSRNAVNSDGDTGPDGSDDSTPLLVAAEHVRACWEQVQATTTFGEDREP
ncbi:hypothetical protein FR943_06750 [Mycobacterium sp. TNTM28]|uniref:Uncharacterized protein n=1 Tax=[Mycobacterium] fortunisiensis TaxID=2600579 RepID=A0ABS6KJ07_9MYCO|nr:hypothetical protein [[Mycobacterium] fortunisiensis]MBU9763540.1 hypothetical protein [[Mycobacterium] fortunisiensis]